MNTDHIPPIQEDIIMLKSVHYTIIDCVFRPHTDGSITQIAHVKKA